MYMYTCSCTIVDLSQIIMALKVQKRGRPKGSRESVKQINQYYSWEKFLKRERKVCLFIIMLFFTLYSLYSDSILVWCYSAVAGDEIVKENDIEVRSEKISVSCLDENVCLESCRKYCSQVTWSTLMGVVDILKENPIWYCERCTNPVHNESQASGVCDCWLNWFHISCLDTKNPPKSKLCFCRKYYDWLLDLHKFNS